MWIVPADTVWCFQTGFMPRVGLFFPLDQTFVAILQGALCPVNLVKDVSDRGCCRDEGEAASALQLSCSAISPRS
jgi:hypothetical protein